MIKCKYQNPLSLLERVRCAFFQKALNCNTCLACILGSGRYTHLGECTENSTEWWLCYGALLSHALCAGWSFLLCGSGVMTPISDFSPHCSTNQLFLSSEESQKRRKTECSNRLNVPFVSPCRCLWSAWLPALSDTLRWVPSNPSGPSEPCGRWEPCHALRGWG